MRRAATPATSDLEGHGESAIGARKSEVAQVGRWVPPDRHGIATGPPRVSMTPQLEGTLLRPPSGPPGVDTCASPASAPEAGDQGRQDCPCAPPLRGRGAGSPGPPHPASTATAQATNANPAKRFAASARRRALRRSPGQCAHFFFHIHLLFQNICFHLEATLSNLLMRLTGTGIILFQVSVLKNKIKSIV